MTESLSQPKHRFKLDLCYDGTNYSGWQDQSEQTGVQTIQGELEKALRQILQQSVSVSGSGRTDAGVHALRQVASFESSTTMTPSTITRALNAVLPPDIRIWRTEEAAQNFHPLRNIARKQYRYLMCDSRPFFPFFQGKVWQVLKPLLLVQMQRAASFLTGTHDFSAFESAGSPRNTSIRTVFDLSVRRIFTTDPWSVPIQHKDGTTSQDEHLHSETPFPQTSLVVIEIAADGFLYNMVRAIAGTLFLFGSEHKGFEDPNRMKEILESKNRQMAGPTAPPYGLYMIDVQYANENNIDSREPLP